MNYSRDSNLIHQQSGRSICAAGLVASLLLALPAVVQAQSYTNNYGVFSNSDFITINDFTNATSYPSRIEVTGLSGRVTNLTVTIQGFSHTWPSDVDILLAEPSGKSVLLMAHVGGSFVVNNVTLTFDDSAASSLPSQGALLSGTYRPTQINPIPAFTSPAPSGPYGTALSAFSDLNPNTVWSLYVRDDFRGDAGVIAGGWSLAISTASKLKLVNQPLSQTAETGSTIAFRVQVEADPPPSYQWFFNGTNVLGGGTNALLQLAEVQSFQEGAYSVVVLNDAGALTSSPAMLNVVAAVARKPVPGVHLIAPVGTFWGLDYRDDLGPTANWETMAVMSLTNVSQFYFDLSAPLPPQRFYRAWQSGTPSVSPSLDLHLVPAITLTGTIGHSVRLDYINQFGPTDAWVTLDTVTLTNTSQLYFDVSAPGQPQRLYRLVQVP